MNPDPQVARSLERARAALLDLSLRNRLLAFRPARRTSVRVVGERAGELFEVLWQKEASLSFLAAEEAAQDSLRTLKTELPADELGRSLLATHRSAVSALEEKGANVLFLALGFLHGPLPGGGPDQRLRAPLLLLPASLARASARARFRLRALEDDPLVNPSLQALLEQRLGLSLPETPESWDQLDPDAWLREAGERLAAAGLSVEADESWLGLFTFQKHLMYLDLEPARWAGAPSPPLRALCGAEVTLPGLPPVADTARPPEECFEVCEADATQRRAVEAALAGVSFVLEGPPGTGKSQTITNLIAESLGAGKRVLFVAEKAAALEVVRARLARAGLADFCLELHSTKTNRRALVDELGRVLAKGRLTAPTAGELAARLQAVRVRLQTYAEALHAPLAPSGLSPREAMGRVARLAAAPELRAALPGLEGLSPERLGALLELGETLGQRLAAVGPVAEHPFRGCGLRALTSDGKLAVRDALSAARAALATSQEASRVLAEHLGAPAPGTLAEAKALRDAALCLANAPPALRPGPVLAAVWDEEAAGKLHNRLSTYRELSAWAASRYRPEALGGVRWAELHARMARSWRSPWRGFSPQYWRDKRLWRDVRLPGHEPARREAPEEVARLASLQALEEELGAGEARALELFGPLWRGLDTDPAVLSACLELVPGLRRARAQGRMGEAGLAWLAEGAERGALEAALSALVRALAGREAARATLRAALELDEPEAFERPESALAELADDALDGRLAAMQAGLEGLWDWAALQACLREAASGPLRAAAEECLALGLPAAAVSPAVARRVHRALAEHALETRPALGGFRAEEHERLRAELAELDARWVRESALRLHARLSAARPEASRAAAPSSPQGVLLGELNRKRGGRPIRRLLVEAGEVIQRLKPCFMMSPGSVAQFLDPRSARFDLVVFDEASQVEPSDALGAAARGAQLVLVGDPRQLPPTAFFQGLTEEPAAAMGEPAAEGAALTDMESVLDRGLAVLPALSLGYHYRSRHDSLIAFSNREFYDQRLLLFPSPLRRGPELGLGAHYHPEDWYARGAGQVNQAQARRVAAWIVEAARARPGRSLGVGAFSQRQQQAIQDELERLRQEDEGLEAFFSLARDEPFFVKNLETIQGDERDVIALSLGYGKTGPGDRLAMNFGPLNQQGGFRRLNVLVTRAREHCALFTSVRPEDFDLGRTDARGVHALERYLRHAFDSQDVLSRPGGQPAEDELMDAVEAALAPRLPAGLELHRRVGSSAYALDLAVFDPAEKRYLLGIEGDGPGFLAAPGVRDRERTRPEMLRGLGWRLVRVWAPAWFRAPGRCLETLVAALEAARAAAPEERAAPAPEPTVQPTQALRRVEAASEAGGEAYRRFQHKARKADGELSPSNLPRLIELALEIVRQEGPVHEEVIVRRLAEALGVGRVTEPRRAAALQAVNRTVFAGQAERRGAFLWPAGLKTAPVRRRAEDDPRNPEHIAPEELEAGVLWVVQSQLAVLPVELPAQVARVLGFATTPPRLGEAVDAALQALLQARRVGLDVEGRVAASGQTLAPPATHPAPRPESSSPAARSPKFCGQCGQPLPSGVKFCGQCGARV